MKMVEVGVGDANDVQVRKIRGAMLSRWDMKDRAPEDGIGQPGIRDDIGLSCLQQDTGVAYPRKFHAQILPGVARLFCKSLRETAGLSDAGAATGFFDAGAFARSASRFAKICWAVAPWAKPLC